jgi:tol-pal system protein YbgF
VLLLATLAGLTLALICPSSALAQKKEYIQLQRDVALLQEQVRDLQQSQEEKGALLKTLLEQALDAVNRMQVSVTEVSQSVQEAQANTQTRVDTLATQVQSLADATDELRARLGEISQQVAETRSVLESVDARLALLGSGEAPEAVTRTPAAGPGPSPPPSADVLYSTALRDFIGGNYDLARQEFADYLNYYGRTQLAGNARFYIGETYYHQKDYRQAIAEYDKVFSDHPKSYKIAGAHLKKGYALLELDEREAGVEELKTLVEKFPGSEEAKWARARLERLGESASR